MTTLQILESLRDAINLLKTARTANHDISSVQPIYSKIMRAEIHLQAHMTEILSEDVPAV